MSMLFPVLAGSILQKEPENNVAKNVILHESCQVPSSTGDDEN